MYYGSQLDNFLTYDPLTRIHTLFTDDRSYIPGSPYPYKVRVYFANYIPGGARRLNPGNFEYQAAEAEGLIYLVDPCIDPFSFSASADTFSGIIEYGQLLEFTYPTLTVEPSLCIVEAAFTC